MLAHDFLILFFSETSPLNIDIIYVKIPIHASIITNQPTIPSDDIIFSLPFIHILFYCNYIIDKNIARQTVLSTAPP